jgi:hypothetical protein
MGILDNDTVIVDAILTKIGRQKLANGQPLGITQYAFGDTGIDYTLYNSAHPSGSDSYGKAITDLPMLEAVPDDNVFLRYKLYTSTKRNVENFDFISITSGTSVTISKVPTSMASQPITIVPKQFGAGSSDSANFDFKILDIRGLTFLGNVQVTSTYDGDEVPFTYPESVVGTISGVPTIEISAIGGAITTQRSIGIEVSKDDSASAFMTVTIARNDFI